MKMIMTMGCSKWTKLYFVWRLGRKRNSSNQIHLNKFSSLRSEIVLFFVLISLAFFSCFATFAVTHSTPYHRWWVFLSPANHLIHRHTKLIFITYLVPSYKPIQKIFLPQLSHKKKNRNDHKRWMHIAVTWYNGRAPYTNPRLPWPWCYFCFHNVYN